MICKVCGAPTRQREDTFCPTCHKAYLTGCEGMDELRQQYKAEKDAWGRERAAWLGQSQYVRQLSKDAGIAVSFPVSDFPRDLQDCVKDIVAERDMLRTRNSLATEYTIQKPCDGLIEIVYDKRWEVWFVRVPDGVLLHTYEVHPYNTPIQETLLVATAGHATADAAFDKLARWRAQNPVE